MKKCLLYKTSLAKTLPRFEEERLASMMALGRTAQSRGMRN